MQVLASALSIMAPLLLAAIGGLFTQLSGMTNIALEGMLMTGAFSTMVFAGATGSNLIGVILGIVVTSSLSLMLALLTAKMKANPFMAGLAANLLASGLCLVISGRIYGTEGVVTFQNLAPLKRAMGQTVFLPVALLAALISILVIRRTPFGIHLRACGTNPEAVTSLGMNVSFYRFCSLIICGALCSIAGSAIMLNLGSYVPNASAGKGWIALVIVFLGNIRPLGIVAAAFIFALADSFSNFAQGFWNIPADFILAIPYLFTFVAMIIYSIIRKKNKSFR